MFSKATGCNTLTLKMFRSPYLRSFSFIDPLCRNNLLKPRAIAWPIF
jgi:hypothetical protein